MKDNNNNNNFIITASLDNAAAVNLNSTTPFVKLMLPQQLNIENNNNAHNHNIGTLNFNNHIPIQQFNLGNNNNANGNTINFNNIDNESKKIVILEKHFKDKNAVELHELELFIKTVDVSDRLIEEILSKNPNKLSDQTLEWCLKSDRIDLVKFFIESGVKIEKNSNLLKLACEKQHIELIKILIEKGVDLKNTDNRLDEIIKNSETLESLTVNINKASLTSLLKHYSNTDTKLLKLIFSSFINYNPLGKYNEILNILLEQNEIKTLYALIKSDVLVFNETGQYNSFLIKILEEDKYALIELLLNKNVQNCFTSANLNLIDHATIETNPKIIKILLENGEKFKSIEKSDQLLHHFFEEDKKIFNLLLDKKAKFKNQESASSLLEKHIKTNEDVRDELDYLKFKHLTLTLITKNKAAFKNQKTANLALKYFFDQEDVVMVEFILKTKFIDKVEFFTEKTGKSYIVTKAICANVNFKIDEDGDTLLHKAVLNNNFEMAKTLLQYGAHYMARNSENKTPYDLIGESYQIKKLLDIYLKHDTEKWSIEDSTPYIPNYEDIINPVEEMGNNQPENLDHIN